MSVSSRRPSHPDEIPAYAGMTPPRMTTISSMQMPDAYRAKQSSARPPMCRSFHAILRHGSWQLPAQDDNQPFINVNLGYRLIRYMRWLCHPELRRRVKTKPLILWRCLQQTHLIINSKSLIFRITYPIANNGLFRG